jgi:hypothetical protein
MTDLRALCADAADYLARLSEKLTTPDDLNEADQLEYRRNHPVGSLGAG